MKLLQCIESMNPALGGTVESTIQMSRGFKQNGASVDILTLDAPEATWGDGHGITVHRVGPSRTYYRYAPRLHSWLRENLRTYSAILINGIWRHHSIGVWRAARAQNIPYYVIPHSMLNPWFRSAFPLKHLKKTVYWKFAEWRTFRDARAVIFGSEEERCSARLSFSPYTCSEVVIPLGTGDPEPRLTGCSVKQVFRRFPQLVGKRLFLFLGRLHPMKGCDVLLNAYAEVARGGDDIHLVIAGPDPTGWRERLQALAVELGIRDQITFTGPTYGESKWALFKAAELFVLPSHCEAFPYALLEALACGLPVLTTNKVNIYRELEQDGCAFVGDDSVDATVASLRRWLSMGKQEKVKMQRRARECFVSRYCNHGAAQRYLDLISGDPLVQARLRSQVRPGD